MDGKQCSAGGRELRGASTCGTVGGVFWKKLAGDLLIQGLEVEGSSSQARCQDNGGWALAVQMSFNQVPFDDDEHEYCVWGNNSFLCSRVSFVKM